MLNNTQMIMGGKLYLPRASGELCSTVRKKLLNTLSGSGRCYCGETSNYTPREKSDILGQEKKSCGKLVVEKTGCNKILIHILQTRFVAIEFLIKNKILKI